MWKTCAGCQGVRRSNTLMPPTRNVRVTQPIKGQKLGDDEWILYDSAHAAGRALALHKGNISLVCWGKQRKTGGYEFRFQEEEQSIDGEEWRDVVMQSD